MMQWTPAMSVDVMLIDDQHKEFIRLINRLEALPNVSDPLKHLGIVLIELNGYVQYHLSTEEELFVLFNYPGAAPHIQDHQRMRDELLAMIDRHINHGENVAAALMHFMITWLSGHIQGEDKKYTQCFHEHGLR